MSYVLKLSGLCCDPLGNKLMSVNVKDCFSISTFLLEKEVHWCEKVQITLTPVAASLC